jgi:hypothetical protein
MSLTLVSRKPGRPASRVRIGGEHDADGVRGYVLLAVSPPLALLAPGTARQVARALVRFAELARPRARERDKSSGNARRSRLDVQRLAADFWRKQPKAANNQGRT